jgi:hypothetical protein
MIEFGRFHGKFVVLVLLLATLLVAWWLHSDMERPQTSSEASATPIEAPTAPDVDAASAKAQTSVPVAKDEAIPLDAKVLGHRATSATRSTDFERLRAALDLAPLLEEFKRRAALGDADAAARMHDILEECQGSAVHQIGIGVVDESMITSGDLGPTRLAVSDPVRVAEMALTQARCTNVLPGADPRARIAALSRAMYASRRLAADLGDVESRIRQQPFERDPQLRIEHSREYARLLLEAGGPEDLFAISAAQAYEGTRYTSPAWVLAACELGYAGCTNPAYFRSQWCAPMGLQCGTQTWRESIQSSTSPGQWREALVQRDEILALWRAGRLDQLLLPRVRAGGGG